MHPTFVGCFGWQVYIGAWQAPHTRVQDFPRSAHGSAEDRVEQ